MSGHPPVVLLDGTATLPRDVLGNKGYGINAMRREGLPVPPAFCITTEVCARYFEDPDATSDSIRDEVRATLRWLEAETSRTFGAGPRPLLVSVRSGAALSMPGMLDTVLDLGIDDAVESALAALYSPEFAADTRQRFCHMYRRIVLGDANGEVPEARLHDMVRRILRTMFAKGLFDSPVVKGPIDVAADTLVAQRDAEEGIVLLKNDKNLLPLAPSTQRITVIGAQADIGMISGGGSSQVIPNGTDGTNEILIGYTALVDRKKPQVSQDRIVFDPPSPLSAIRSEAPRALVQFDDRGVHDQPPAPV